MRVVRKKLQAGYYVIDEVLYYRGKPLKLSTGHLQIVTRVVHKRDLDLETTYEAHR